METIVTEKRCRKCRQVKSLEQFPKTGAQCKACRYEYRKKWAAANKEKVSGYQKKYRDAHPEKMKEKGRRKYAAQGERFLAEISRWRAENPDKKRESAKQWRANNRDRVSKYNRKQAEAHPEVKRLNNEKRRAREASAGGMITAKQWSELVEQYGNRCLCCGRENVKLTLDHVLPLVLGGAHAVENAQPLCGSCNSKKGTKHIDYRGIHE